MAGRYRSDLAEERERRDPDTAGVAFAEEMIGGFRVTTTESPTKEGMCPSSSIYITITHPEPHLLGEEQRRELSHTVSTLLSRLFPTPITARDRILIVGLGNRAITADSLGVKCCERIAPTGHLPKADPALFSLLAAPAVFLLTPSVPAETGLDGMLLIHKAADTLRPTLILLIDSLVARSPLRLLRTIQLSNAGLAPGSGIRQGAHAIDHASLGIPVLSIGIPTAIEVVRDRVRFLAAPASLDPTLDAASAILAAGISHALFLPT